MSAAVPRASSVRTWAVGRVKPIWLGELGPVTDLTYGWTVPGGYAQMACTLVRPPDYRTEALDPGRIVDVCRGGSVIWNGKLDEPQPGAGGWTITAHGAGTFGTEWDAIYSTWSNQNDAVNSAIGRGLPWVNPGGNSVPSSVWLGQQQDSGSLKIADLLDLFTSKGGLTWWVGRGNVLTVGAIPSTPTALLISDAPAGRTLAGDKNAILLRYQSSANNAAHPAYATTFATNAASITKHGRIEDYDDLSSSGFMTAAAAQAVGTNSLAKYVRASYSDPFTVTPGQLLTMGGQPVDGGARQPGGVVRVMIIDASLGGEVTAAPISFPIGSYSWDDENMTATLQAFAAPNLSLSGLLSSAALVNAPGTGTARYQHAALAAARAKAAAAARAKHR